jgi:hypothetical protein
VTAETKHLLLSLGVKGLVGTHNLEKENYILYISGVSPTRI